MLSFKALAQDIRHFFDAATGVRHSRVTLHSDEKVQSPDGIVPKFSITTTVTGDQAAELQRLGSMVVSLERPELAAAKEAALAQVQVAQQTAIATENSQPIVPTIVPVQTPVDQSANEGDPHAQAALVVSNGTVMNTEAPVEGAVVDQPVANTPPVDAGAGPTSGTSVGV